MSPNGYRFDALARLLAARVSRRSLEGGLAALAVAAFARVASPTTADAKKRKKKKKKPTCKPACRGDLSCRNGRCACASGVACDTRCTDTSSDREHCGECDHACTDSETCVQGRCVSCVNNAECSGQADTCTDGTCTCGARPACAEREICANGQCDCPGCRNDDGTCRAGINLNFCGVDGETCVSCAEGESCLDGECRCLRPGDDLQAIIDAADAGATLCLAAGSFVLTRTLVLDKDLALVGAGADETFLNGNEQVGILYVASGQIHLSHVTLADGDGNLTAGGIYIDEPASLVLDDCRVVGCTGARGSGGILNLGALTMIDATIADNTAGWGGGLINSERGQVTMTRCTITGNSATGTPDVESGWGGGIYNENDMTMTDCTVSLNTVQGFAGGILTAGDSTLEMTNCAISGNTATGDGGGMVNAIAAATILAGCSITGNASSARGGGFFNRGSLNGAECLVADNDASDTGGGFHIQAGSVTLTDSNVTRNETESRGGGFYQFDGELTLENCDVTENAAAVDGGGISNLTGSVFLSDGCEVRENDPNNCLGSFFNGEGCAN